MTALNLLSALHLDETRIFKICGTTIDINKMWSDVNVIYGEHFWHVFGLNQWLETSSISFFDFDKMVIVLAVVWLP